MKDNSNEAIPLILDFCHWLKKEKKSPGTITTYKRELERFQEWLQERQRDMKDVTKSDIKGYTLFLEQQQKSVATIDKTMGAIRTFAKFLEKPDLTFGIKLEPVIKEDIETLSLNQYNLLLSDVKKDGNLRDIAIVYMLLHTGIRVSELCSLNRSNVDLIKNEIIIEKVEDKRTIPLSNEVRLHLENYLQAHSVKDAIFITKLGERITERAVQYMLKKYNVNPNKLRHTFCQRLVDSGVDLDIVSRLAGIKDLNVIKRYVKRSSKDKNRLEQVIQNTFFNDTLG
ncbi:MAG: tyrosine-type recombinase/integrase [Heyndrickxia sp.]